MQTIAGRTANEIYREHMFQLALTFHAGMEVVAYEWGAPSWLDHLSPDDEAQAAIGGAYSRYGAGWSKSKPYKYGTMNDEVYFVRGGMEDCKLYTQYYLQPIIFMSFFLISNFHCQSIQ
ncbi:MAG: hypothetical protein ACI8RD_010607 [Bacillariaceae sp.]|jgi:hypothetical protein